MFRLIYIFLLFSFTSNKKCAPEDCGSFNIDGENPTHYICSSSDDDTCSWKLLCDYVQKPDSDTDSFKCSDQPVTVSNKFTCIDDNNSCKEISFCEETIISSEEYSNFDCSKYPLKDEETKENMVCTKDLYSDKCIEQYLCGTNPELDKNDFLECERYPVSSDKKYTYYCAFDENENKCIEEKLKCANIYKPDDNTIIRCIDFSDKESICLDDTTESEMACIQRKYCSYTTEEDLMHQTDCAVFPVSNPDKFSCVKNDEKNLCEEIYFCLQAPKSEGGDCSNFIVSEENFETHGCIEDLESDTNKCKEVVYCELVENNNNENINCENYPVKNKKTHVCIKNNNAGGTSCKEEKLCQYYNEGTNDEECRQYYVENANTACIKNPNSNLGCIEKELCTSVENGVGVDCSAYPVSQKNMKTHVCKNIANSGSSSKACEEVLISNIECLKAEKGDNDEQCSKYKVSNASKKCIKNPSPIISSGYTVCIEIDISECQLKNSGIINDEECNILSVENSEEQKCVKNPDGDNCIILSYCEYANGNSNDDCAKYALKDEEKNVCVKSKYANKCIEIEKTEEIDIEESEEDTTDDISSDNQDNNEDNNKENKDRNSGYFINIIFSFVFINCFFILF